MLHLCVAVCIRHTTLLGLSLDVSGPFARDFLPLKHVAKPLAIVLEAANENGHRERNRTRLYLKNRLHRVRLFLGTSLGTIYL